MLQTIYTLVSDADITSCGKKGKPIKSEPIPLIRDKYLGEYRTALEKARVRENLGISDGVIMKWGNISGTLEELSDLIKYVESKYSYKTELNEDVTNIKQAVDYALAYVSTFKSDTESIAQLKETTSLLKESIVEVENSYKAADSTINSNIETLSNKIDDINKLIEQINESIENIDVDKNILNWVNSHLTLSNTIELTDDSLEVILSDKEDNAIELLKDLIPDTEDYIIQKGLYVKNLLPDVNDLKESTSELSKQVDTLNNSIIYTTDLPDDTTSSVISGTTVESLKNKTFGEILDTLIFPTVVRDLVYPQCYYSGLTSLVEVGSEFLTPNLIFYLGDAGDEIERITTITYKGSDVTSYSNIGEYNYSSQISYNEGEYLIDNKGQTTSKRIEAGSCSTSLVVTATYPWYAGNTSSVDKLELVAFNKNSGTITIYLSGKSVIKLPGANSLLLEFKVDGGLGYLDVDLSAWTQSTLQINNYIYKVWTKEDSYASSYPHQISFKLVE